MAKKNELAREVQDKLNCSYSTALNECRRRQALVANGSGEFVVWLDRVRALPPIATADLPWVHRCVRCLGDFKKGHKCPDGTS